ncbi:MAG: hypothetical protein KF760_20190 [Candidatus Eremiobacteraeota bacterium]|nr:hypothetical protein [Candidatus Eremiobacteraeota bacterium]MCW5868161.1 hypothetical protein [Candidatus Eremiobacteraeota bacterium]
MSRCLDLCSDQPLLGSATISQHLVIVDRLRPWTAKTQDCLTLPPEWQARLDDWRAQEIPFTLLARHSDQGAIHSFEWRQGRVTDREGAPVSEKFLVCTHGSRDVCCGTLGPRLAQALRAAGHQEVWEVSHIGGHRFAPTLWHLPSWRVYGRLSLESPQCLPRFLRGHAAYQPPLQVMEARLFQERGLWPLWLEPGEGGCLVHWPDGTCESWHFSLARHEHHGPMSCRDIPEGKYEPYTSLEVVAAEMSNFQPAEGVQG